MRFKRLLLQGNTRKWLPTIFTDVKQLKNKRHVLFVSSFLRVWRLKQLPEKGLVKFIMCGYLQETMRYANKYEKNISNKCFMRFDVLYNFAFGFSKYTIFWSVIGSYTTVQENLTSQMVRFNKTLKYSTHRSRFWGYSLFYIYVFYTFYYVFLYTFFHLPEFYISISATHNERRDIYEYSTEERKFSIFWHPSIKNI